MLLFITELFDYSQADCSGLCDDLKDFMWDMLKLVASVAAEFCE